MGLIWPHELDAAFAGGGGTPVLPPLSGDAKLFHPLSELDSTLSVFDRAESIWNDLPFQPYWAHVRRMVDIGRIRHQKEAVFVHLAPVHSDDSSVSDDIAHQVLQAYGIAKAVCQDYGVILGTCKVDEGFMMMRVADSDDDSWVAGFVNQLRGQMVRAKLGQGEHAGRLRIAVSADTLHLDTDLDVLDTPPDLRLELLSKATGDAPNKVGHLAKGKGQFAGLNSGADIGCFYLELRSSPITLSWDHSDLECEQQVGPDGVWEIADDVRDAGVTAQVGGSSACLCVEFDIGDSTGVAPGKQATLNTYKNHLLQTLRSPLFREFYFGVWRGDGIRGLVFVVGRDAGDMELKTKQHLDRILRTITRMNRLRPERAGFYLRTGAAIQVGRIFSRDVVYGRHWRNPSVDLLQADVCEDAAELQDEVARGLAPPVSAASAGRRADAIAVSVRPACNTVRLFLNGEGFAYDRLTRSYNKAMR